VTSSISICRQAGKRGGNVHCGWSQPLETAVCAAVSPSSCHQSSRSINAIRQEAWHDAVSRCTAACSWSHALAVVTCPSEPLHLYSLCTSPPKSVHIHLMPSQCFAMFRNVLQGEAATVAAFQSGPYGCSGSLLEKKARRDPFAVGPPHPSRCPAMAGLLKYCSHKQYTGAVPWETAGQRAAAAGDAVAGGGSKSGESGSSGKGGLLPSGRRSSRSGIYT
jgi:hypothetical protein